MSATLTPSAGITITSVLMSGGPYANGEIRVLADDASYNTEWYAYTAPPLPPSGWPKANDPPVTAAPGQCWVMLKTSKPVNFPSNPISLNVVKGRRTRIVIDYP